ncbi:MAG: hypothetical protein IT304_08115 [Dehalococcoidia bacterium]|nr:hypothetical protein [Dehalococcoidia bacterium]
MSRASWSRFFGNHGPVVRWIMVGLGLFVVAGVVAAIVTAMNTGETGEPANGSGAIVEPAGGGTPGATATNAARPADSAVAGVRATAVLRAEAGGFAPAALTLPRGSTLLVTVARPGDCTLTINGEGVGRTLRNGDEFTWSADTPGHYDFACQGDGLPGAGVLVP